MKPLLQEIAFKPPDFVAGVLEGDLPAHFRIEVFRAGAGRLAGDGVAVLQGDAANGKLRAFENMILDGFHSRIDQFRRQARGVQALGLDFFFNRAVRLAWVPPFCLVFNFWLFKPRVWGYRSRRSGVSGSTCGYHSTTDGPSVPAGLPSVDRRTLPPSMSSIASMVGSIWSSLAPAGKALHSLI